jgi:hypothetical protein
LVPGIPALPGVHWGVYLEEVSTYIVRVGAQTFCAGVSELACMERIGTDSLTVVEAADIAW